MRIGIDYRPALLGRAGIARYTRELCRALGPGLAPDGEQVLFCVSGGRARSRDLPAAARAVYGFLPGRLLDLLGKLKLLSVERFTGGLDLFFYTDYVYPPLHRTPAVMILYDLLFMENPAFHGPYFQQKMIPRVAAALARARGVIVPSQAVRSDLERFFPGLPAPVRVIPLGGDHLPPGPAAERGRYLLSVGTREPRKNRLTLLRAFESIVEKDREVELRVVGRPGWLDQAFEEALRRSPARQKIRLLETVDDAYLARLYRGAMALVYPSLGEGFGLPVAEAMHLGCPVITSKAPALPEVAGEAAWLVDPQDAEDLARAMGALLSQPGERSRLIEAGRQRARTLTWEKTAAQTLVFFKECLRRGDRC